MITLKKSLQIVPLFLFFSAHLESAGFVIRLPQVHAFCAKLIASHKAETAKVLSNPKLFKFKKKPFKPDWLAYDIRKVFLAKHLTEYELSEKNFPALALRLEQSEDKQYQKCLDHALEESKKKNWVSLATLGLRYQRPVTEEEKKKRLNAAIKQFFSTLSCVSLPKNGSGAVAA